MKAPVIAARSAQARTHQSKVATKSSRSRAQSDTAKQMGWPKGKKRGKMSDAHREAISKSKIAFYKKKKSEEKQKSKPKPKVGFKPRGLKPRS